MTHIIGNHQLQQFEKTVAGDLVVFTNDGERAVGFVMEFNEDREPLIAVLESNFGLPRLLRVGHDKLCVTLGKEWAIGPLDDKTAAPDHLEIGRRAGMLVLARTGWLMNFATSGLDGLGRFSWVWVDLSTYASLEKHVDKGMAFARWQLWIRAADADVPGRKPLLDYAAQSQSSRAS